MNGRPLAFGLTVTLGLLAAVGARAQPAPPPFGGPALAQDRVLSRAIESLEVSSSALLPGGVIPVANSGYGKSISFPISWSPVQGAKAYAVIMEQLDPGETRATLYWLAYNIPGDVTALGRSVHNKEVIPGPKGLMQGRNSWGGIGYVGPRPPQGDPPHHFHIQVFALSKMLGVGGGADLNAVIKAMNDRVIAEGELIATFEAPKPGEPRLGKPAAPQ